MPAYRIPAAILLVITVISCEGPMGPAGPPGDPTGALSDPSIMPKVIYTYPGANTTGPYPELYRYDCGFEWCSYYSQFQVRFNKFMDLTSVRRAVRLSSPVGDIHADTNFIISVGGDVFILIPVDSNGYRSNFRFKIGATYSIGVDSTARDINGNSLVPPFTALFVPEPTFHVMDIYPENGSIDVDPGSGVQIAFNSRIDTSILSHISIAPAVRGNWWIGYDSVYVVFNTVEPLALSTPYVVMVDGSAEDTDGNPIGGQFVAGFRTIDFRLSSASPPPGAEKISPNSTIYASFTLALDTATMRSAFHLTPATTLDFTNIYFGTTSYTVVPRNGLLSSTTYTVRIDSTLRSLSGAHLDTTIEYSFTTAPFGVAGTTPEPGAEDVALSQSVRVNFNASIDPASVDGAFSISPVVGGLLSVEGTALSFVPVEFAARTRYTVTIDTSLAAYHGGGLQTPFSFSFTTGSFGVYHTHPADGDTGHPVNYIIYISFSGSLDTASIPGSFALRDSTGVLIPAGFLYYRQNPWQFVIDPDSNLEPGALYTVTISTSVRSKGGSAPEAPYIFSFRTAR